LSEYKFELAAAADVVLDASVDQEACPLNLCTDNIDNCCLAIGDALAMAIMEAKT